MEQNGSWLNGVVTWFKLPRLYWQGILLLFLKKWIEGLNYDTSYLSWFVLGVGEIFASFWMVLSVAYFFLPTSLISRYLEDSTEEFQQESIACVILTSLSSFYKRSIDWTVEEVSYVGKLVRPFKVCCSHKYILHYFPSLCVCVFTLLLLWVLVQAYCKVGLMLWLLNLAAYIWKHSHSLQMQCNLASILCYLAIQTLADLLCWWPLRLLCSRRGQVGHIWLRDCRGKLLVTPGCLSRPCILSCSHFILNLLICWCELPPCREKIVGSIC